MRRDGSGEQIGREAELRPGHQPKVNVNEIEELVTEKGYHSGAVVERVKSYPPEKQQKGRRNWQGKAEEQQAVYQNRGGCAATTARAWRRGDWWNAAARKATTPAA